MSVKPLRLMCKATASSQPADVPFPSLAPGEVSLLRNNILLAVCGAGTFVGETAVFNDLAGSSGAEPGSGQFGL